MTIIVVTRVASLAAAIGSQLDAVGIDPEDLEGALEEMDALAGAVVDCSSVDTTLEVADMLRHHDPWAPLVLLLAGDTLPERERTDALDPVRLVRRPFTTAQVVEHMSSMQRTAFRPDPAPPELDSAAATPTGEDPAPAPPPADDETRAKPGRRGWRSKPAHERLAVSTQSPVDAARVLMSSDLPVPTHQAAESLVRAISQFVTDTTAVAVLVRDGTQWMVEAGRGVRPNEARTVIGEGHWLSARVSGRDTAVVVNGTDVARQELTGVPLIHFENWMATTMADSSVMVVVGRDEGPPFDVKDAVRLTDASREYVDAITESVVIRSLARRLQDNA